LVVKCNRIPRFTGFVANDMHGSVTIFGHLLFRVFHTINPIKKVCCNFVIDDEWLITNDEIVQVFGHVEVSQIGYRVVLVQKKKV
jgi:hypothetical protein